MRTTRLYHAEQLQCGETAQLDANASSHLIRVLRKKIGTNVILFNGDGYDYLCRTLDASPKKTLLAVESKSQKVNESNLSITLIQGLSRQDRMEATIQKSVELGANKIIPVMCQRSNTKLPQAKQIKKLDHWRKVAISACEQSGRSIIPEVTEVIPLNNIDSALQPQALKVLLNPESNTSLKDISIKHPSVEIFIGPEGGLTEQEVSQLLHDKFNSICFGPRILRTETAGPAVISALQMLWGDF